MQNRKKVDGREVLRGEVRFRRGELHKKAPKTSRSPPVTARSPHESWPKYPGSGRLLSMKCFALSFSILVCAILVSGCGREVRRQAADSAALQAGALYSLSDGEGGYRAGKIIAVEDDVAFVHLFAKRWTKRPALEEAKKGGAPAPVAFTSQTIAGMQPMFLGKGTISAEESAAYQTWKASDQAVF